jgi:putative ABC transport system permease protein
VTSGRVLLRYGLRSLLLHKLRSSLSILGVVFGVGAVVAMASVGEGARQEAIAQIGALGIDTVTVRSHPTPGSPSSGSASARRHPSAASCRMSWSWPPCAKPPSRWRAEGNSLDATAVGTTPDYTDAAHLTLQSGRFLAALDLQDRKRVVVLGATVARALFPFGDGRGERVAMGGDWFQVVGVLEERATARGKPGPIRTRDVNRCVFVPWPALDRGTDARPDGVDELVVRISDPDRVGTAAEVVRSLLARVTGGAALEVIVPREILRQRERTQRIFNAVTGAVAAMSLLVGGIGIMNIMLASVAERTREVGVRRALGATRKDIAAQFLVESSLLTSIGRRAGGDPRDRGGGPHSAPGGMADGPGSAHVARRPVDGRRGGVGLRPLPGLASGPPSAHGGAPERLGPTGLRPRGFALGRSRSELLQVLLQEVPFLGGIPTKRMPEPSTTWKESFRMS